MECLGLILVGVKVDIISWTFSNLLYKTAATTAVTSKHMRSLVHCNFGLLLFTVLLYYNFQLRIIPLAQYKSWTRIGQGIIRVQYNATIHNFYNMNLNTFILTVYQFASIFVGFSSYTYTIINNFSDIVYLSV